ncbi:Protein Bicaudal D-like 2 [Manis pentadactyla]|nr:Protein Bicaudal D-like 2 [Manis pentadactyla]
MNRSGETPGSTYLEDFKKGAGESNKLVPGGRIAGEGSGRFLVVEVGGPEIWEAKQDQTQHKGSLCEQGHEIPAGPKTSRAPPSGEGS